MDLGHVVASNHGCVLFSSKNRKIFTLFTCALQLSKRIIWSGLTHLLVNQKNLNPIRLITDWWLN